MEQIVSASVRPLADRAMPARFRPRPVPIAEGQREEASIHFIKYMGSKRNILPFLAPVLRDVVPRNGMLLDLFAGTHAVGYALKTHARVWGNDIQNYSVPIGKTLLCTDPTTLRTSDTSRLVQEAAARHYARSSSLWRPWLRKERWVFEQAGLDSNIGLAAYQAYIEGLDAALPHGGDIGRLSTRLQPKVRRVMRGRRSDPPMMAAAYWPTSYFSLDQCLWLDAFRQAIDDLPEGHVGRAPALACLLHAAAYCTHGTGHFAQHRKVTGVEVLDDTMIYRQRSVAEYWAGKMAQVEAELAVSVGNNRVTTQDYTAALDDLGGVGAIYADPPYSFVHYSRFYHVLETLTLYDHPGTEFDGRYRPVPMRHQSPFCIRSRMADAFETVLKAGRDAGIPVVWSYSRSGLMPFDTLLALCKEYYPDTTVLEQRHLHTTMGRREDKTREVSEVLIVCA